MVVRLSGDVNYADVVGTIVPAGMMTRKQGETANEALKRAVEEEKIKKEIEATLQKVTAPLIKVTKTTPLIVRAENPINPLQSTGKIYVEGKAVEEQPVLEQLTPQNEDVIDLLKLIPLSALGFFALIL